MAQFVKYLRGVWIGGFDEAVVGQLSITPAGDESRTLQVCEMARDFGLVGVEYIDARADANLIVAYQVDKAQPRAVGESFEKHFRSIAHRVSDYDLKTREVCAFAGEYR